ncbi:hypothetical protein K501DRAFT_323250, partial [Backusella circina FSU 941]
MAQIKFYDLELNTPQLVWSPNTCKTRFALNYKNIPYETEWVDFSNLHRVVANATQNGKRPTVPIIEDFTNNNKVIQESWAIALYLEENFPGTPSLFHGNVGAHKFFHNYATTQVLPIIFKFCVLHIQKNCGPQPVQDWFRKDREKFFKKTLEDFVGDENSLVIPFKNALKPIHTVLAEYPFVTGQKAGWADLVLASYFTMLNAIRPELFESIVLNGFGPSDSTFRNWWTRMEVYRGTVPLARL